MSDHEPDGHIRISPNVLYLLLAGTALGGAGSYGVMGPQLERSAIEACYDNSKIALGVTAQHGEEFVQVRGAIRDTRTLIFDRTQSRYTAEDADKFRRSQEVRDEAQDRRASLVDKRLDRIERHSEGHDDH